MDEADDDRLRRVGELCREAREVLGSSGPFRLRVALDIAEIECALEQERLSSTSASPSSEPD